MAGKKLYTGFVLEDDTIKIARISVSGKTATLEKVDKVKLVSALQKSGERAGSEEVFDAFDNELDDDSIFGLDDDFNSDIDELDDDLNLDLDLDLDDLESQDAILDVEDMTSEAEGDLASSNELLMFNVLSDMDSTSIRLSLNIPAGATIFQILKDIDFASIKKKDLQVIIDDRLEALYGSPKTKDYYSSIIRDDGSLLLVSIGEQPQVLELIQSAENLYTGKIIINEILPDESIDIGLFRANYEVDPESITALIQYSEESCRIIFLKGNNLLIISPMITEGSSSRKFLNTVFSKILFQLDTGEVPNLDQIVLYNNSLGEEAISFFEDRFPDIKVSNFEYDENVFDASNIDSSTVASFTTAIALAWADADFEKKSFPNISFVPGYIKDRQKIFKLQWHGFLLLALILSVFPIANYFYLSNAAKIESLQDNVADRKAEIRSLETTVQEYNRINSELSGIQTRLELLDELSEKTLAWTVNIDLINKGIDNIDSIWLTNLLETSGGGIEISGIALYRNRIPMVADMFSQALLIDVQRTLIREEEVYSFTYVIPKIVANTDRYTPETAKGLKDILREN